MVIEILPLVLLGLLLALWRDDELPLEVEMMPRVERARPPIALVPAE